LTDQALSDGANEAPAPQGPLLKLDDFVYTALMDEDQIIAERISGKSVRAIAKSQGCSVAQVNHVVDAWAEEAIDEQLRKAESVS
jgi:hypothetical protein